MLIDGIDVQSLVAFFFGMLAIVALFVFGVWIHARHYPHFYLPPTVIRVALGEGRTMVVRVYVNGDVEFERDQTNRMIFSAEEIAAMQQLMSSDKLVYRGSLVQRAEAGD
jgi:hypothetical protein